MYIGTKKVKSLPIFFSFYQEFFQKVLTKNQK